MQITHNGKTYTITIGSSILWEEAIKMWINNGDMELIEEDAKGDIRIAEMLENAPTQIYTKGETKPCEHKAGNPVYLVDGKLTCSRCHLPYEENWCEQKHYSECKGRETKPLVENALPFDRSSEYKGYKMKIEETKPEEKPQFDDSQLLIGRNTYNPFTNECKEIPEEKLTEEERIMEACKPYVRGTVEKPNWYVDIEEMKKSEYWEIFKEWFDGKASPRWTPKYTEPRYGYSIELGYTPLVCGYECLPKLSPQQWYDTIYDGEKLTEADKKARDLRLMGKMWRNEGPDHDKAMEIPEVPEYEYERQYANSSGSMYYSNPDKEQIKALTNSLNAVIKKINNL